MKLFLSLLLIIALFPLQVLFSQSSPTDRQAAEMKNAISIHQYQWQQYRDYVPRSEMPPFEGKPVPLVPKRVPPTREVFGYLPYWTYSGYPNLNYGLLTTIAYFGADVDGFGNFVNLHNWPAAGLINQAHSNGVRVVLTVILFNSSQLSTLLSSATNRTNLINNLLAQVQSAGADGVSIDFEGMPGSQRQNLTTFMTELTDAFHTAIPGSYITIFTPAVDWSNAFEYYNLAQICDGLIIQGYDYHWGSGPTAGPTAPLTSGSVWGYWNVTRSVEDYLTKTLNNSSKLILSVPFYGFEWPTANDNLGASTLGSATTLFYSTAYSNAQQYGRLWDSNSQTPWYKYNDGQWHQGWYDDSLSLSLKFDLINQKNLKGTAIWALTYDGQRQELQQAISNAFGSTAPPFQPTDFRITNIGNGAVAVAVKPTSGATAYRLYQSTDGTNFDSGTDFPSATIILNALSADSTYYFKMTAVNGNGESNPTEVLAVRPTAATADVLIVNGFDRTTGTTNTFDFIRRYAPSLVKTGHAFDAAANEAVEDSSILLSDYAMVIWILGEEGTATESFSSTEQARVADYLENGGQLFVSGSEIGYDLVQKGTTADKLFYRNYLKAQYVMDRVPVYTVSPTANGIFNGLGDMTFDNGSHGTYNVDYPDGINPIDGSVGNLNYKGFPPATYGGAGIQYEGLFGQGSVPGRVVYLAVPYETFYPAATRDSLMAHVIQFFDSPMGLLGQNGNGSLPQDFTLEQNYPNPFNPSTTIPFTIGSGTSRQVQLTIFDILGREVITLMNGQKPAGQYKVVWDGRDRRGVPVPGGIYLVRLKVGTRAQTRKITLLK